VHPPVALSLCLAILVGQAGKDEGVSDDLTGLGPQGFERLCRALAACVLGPGIEAFGSGPDGGREAAFRGPQQYPTSARPWDGYGVLQAKYKERLLGTGSDTAWLRRQVKAELEAWGDSGSGRVLNGQRPEYLIFATNVPLSSVRGSGGKDRIGDLIAGYVTVLGLKDWRVWDAAQITTLLDAYPQVRRAFAALITPSEVLARMHDQLGSPPEVSVVLNMPAPAVRPGQPGIEAAFGEAYAAAGGAARLGQALGEAQPDGPGWVQHFSGAPAGGDSAVICARYGHPAVAVAGRVWNALARVGGTCPGGGTTGAGLPVPTQVQGSFIGADSQEIELADGKWGPGRLVRAEPDQWTWQPDVAFDSQACRDRDSWGSRDGQMDLRLRVAAQIPVAGAGELRVTNAGRALMLAALRTEGLDRFILALAERYGLPASRADWAETPEPVGHNNSRFAGYQIPITGAAGKLAILGSAWFSLPGSYSDALSCIADLRISFEAIRPEPASGQARPAPIPPDLRAAPDELTRFFAQAWHVTTMILPMLVTALPAGLPPGGAPRLELYIQNEHPETSGHDRTLRTLDMIDLTRYGQPRQQHLGDLSIGITTPLGLPKGRIAGLVDDAMLRMTEDFGFTGPADPDLD